MQSVHKKNLIEDLRKEAADKNTVELCDGFVGFKFHNVTKYYENDIVFLSHESKHINLVPLELLDQVEGVIVYFDSDNVCFCNIARNSKFHINFLLQFTERFLAKVADLCEFHRTEQYRIRHFVVQ